MMKVYRGILEMREKFLKFSIKKFPISMGRFGRILPKMNLMRLKGMRGIMYPYWKKCLKNTQNK